MFFSLILFVLWIIKSCQDVRSFVASSSIKLAVSCHLQMTGESVRDLFQGTVLQLFLKIEKIYEECPTSQCSERDS
jgi:hypothetical protein